MEGTTEIKLNIGSNDFQYPGFINVDIRDVLGVDVVDDVRTLSKFEDNSIYYIKAEYILEHFAPDQTVDILKVWYGKLKKGGFIEVMVPDGELIFDRYLNGDVQGHESPYYHNWEQVIHSMFGNMDYLRKWHGDMAEFYAHHTLFSKDWLKKEMTDAGFKDFEPVHPRHQDGITWKAKK